MYKFEAFFQKAYVFGMKHFIGILLLLGIFSSALMAQSSTNSSKPAIIKDLQSNQSGKGNVHIVQDPALDDLLNRHIERNRRNDGMMGFRIRIFNDANQNNKERAQKRMSEFMRAFPELETSYLYDQPYSKVYVGYFRTKSDANKVKAEIEKQFPEAIIVETRIRYPKN